jgi:L-threonylcarbamoyladenylate synthase
MNSLEQQVEKGIRILKKGGTIAFPTDTVYGLGCDAFRLRAVERVYEVKRRPRHLPFPLLLGDISQATAVAKPLSGIALSLARRFWPGALTLVLPKSDSLPLYLSSGGTVAVRIPGHPICLALIQGIGSPLVGTSANISGSYSALTANEVEQQLGDAIDFVIDGGKCPGGNESTIVDVTGAVPRILRQGMIPRHEIERLWSPQCVSP